MEMKEIFSTQEIAYIDKIPARIKKVLWVIIPVSLMVLFFMVSNLYSAMQMGKEHGIYRFTELLSIFFKFDVKLDQSYTGWELCLTNKIGCAFIWFFLLILIIWPYFSLWLVNQQFLNKLYKDPGLITKSDIKKFKKARFIKWQKYIIIAAGIVLLTAALMHYQLAIKIAGRMGINNWKELLVFYFSLHYDPNKIYDGCMIFLHQMITQVMIDLFSALIFIPGLYFIEKLIYTQKIISKGMEAIEQNLNETKS
jgi:hypothetical protein